MIWIQNQLVSAQLGQSVTLECHSEAYPKAVNFWTKDNGEILSQGNLPTYMDNRALFAVVFVRKCSKLQFNGL